MIDAHDFFEQHPEATADEGAPVQPEPEPAPAPEPEPVAPPVAPDHSLAALLQDVQALADAHGVTLAALHDGLHEAIGYRSA